MKIPVYFSEHMVAHSGHTVSPSAHKPKLLVQQLLNKKYPIEIRAPIPVTKEDFYKVHDKEFVDGVLSLRLENGFENHSESVARSLPYTSGAMLTAARAATKDCPTVAPVSGFHHAEFNRAMGFCTFNGLMVTAYKMVREQNARVAIIDCDMHYGNGTDNILRRDHELASSVFHLTFGRFYGRPSDAASYMTKLKHLRFDLEEFEPTIILYQAGADVHVNDPHGGILTTEEMKERDVIMFSHAKELGIPLCWNLAGGYQKDPDGGCQIVLDLHLNTFDAALEVYGKSIQKS